MVDMVDKPLFFRALSIIIPPGEKSDVSMADSVLYQVSGSTEVAAGGTKILAHDYGGNSSTDRKIGSRSPSRAASKRPPYSFQVMPC